MAWSLAYRIVISAMHTLEADINMISFTQFFLFRFLPGALPSSTTLSRIPDSDRSQTSGYLKIRGDDILYTPFLSKMVVPGLAEETAFIRFFVDEQVMVFL